MPRSNLTVRTLALATVAFVLACGHAVKAMGAQKATPERPIVKAPTSSTIRVVPAGSGHSTVATFSNSGRGGRGGAGGSHIVTFTKAGGGGSKSVVTISGDRVEKARQVASATRKPQQLQGKNKKPGILPERGDPPVIAVRRLGAPAEAPKTEPRPEIPTAPAAEATQPYAAVKPTPRLRNAFGGLSSRASSEAAGSGQVYAHASAR